MPCNCGCGENQECPGRCSRRHLRTPWAGSRTRASWHLCSNRCWFPARSKRSRPRMMNHLHVCIIRFDTAALVQSPLAETPLFVGRAVSAFARDRTKFDFTGKAGGFAVSTLNSILVVGFLRKFEAVLRRLEKQVLLPATMAAGYGLIDERGLRTPPFNSIKSPGCPMNLMVLVCLIEAFDAHVPLSHHFEVSGCSSAEVNTPRSWFVCCHLHDIQDELSRI